MAVPRRLLLRRPPSLRPSHIFWLYTLLVPQAATGRISWATSLPLSTTSAPDDSDDSSDESGNSDVLISYQEQMYRLVDREQIGGGGTKRQSDGSGSGRKSELWFASRLPNGNVLYTHPKGGKYEDNENLQGLSLKAKLDTARATYCKSCKRQQRSSTATSAPAETATSAPAELHPSSQGAGSPANVSASPTTVTKPYHKRGRGRSPNGMRWDTATGEWVDCPKAAARHAAQAEAKGKAASIEVKKREEAVLSSFMKAHEALAEQQPERRTHHS